MRSATERCDGTQRELAAYLAMPQGPKVARSAILDLLGQHSSSVRAAETAVQKHLKSTSRNYVQTVFKKVIKSTSTYQLTVKSKISSLGMELTHEVWSMCAQIIKLVNGVSQDVSCSGEGEFS